MAYFFPFLQSSLQKSRFWLLLQKDDTKPVLEHLAVQKRITQFFYATYATYNNNNKIEALIAAAAAAATLIQQRTNCM